MKQLFSCFLFRKRPEDGLSAPRRAAFWLWNGLLMLGAALALGLLCLMLAPAQYGWELFYDYLDHPGLVALNLIPPVVLMALLYGLTGRAWLAYALTALPVLGLAAGNAYKMFFRDDPVIAADLRMTAVYTDPMPNPKTPQTIKVVDKELEVLESAWDTIGDLKPGDNVSLLLTADGMVAGIVPASAQVRSTAIGTASSGGVTVYLPNGGTLELSGKVSNASSVTANEPVVISSVRDAFTVSRLVTSRAPGVFNVTNMTLGDLTVSPSVRIYEQLKGSTLQPVDRGSLTMDTIPADKVSYHTNSSGIVDYIVLEDVTGVAYIYGMMVGGYEGEEDHEKYVWHLRSGSQEIDFARTTSYKGSSGDMVGVVLGSNQEGSATIREIIKLQEVKQVNASDFFDSQGEPYVRVGAHTYRISSDVECYYNRTGNQVAKDNWLTNASGTDRFNAIKTYSQTYTIYIDPVGQQVRIIVAN